MSKYNDIEYRHNRGVVIWAHYKKCGYLNCENGFNHVHHIDGNNQNNHILNLIPLCEIHHNIVHKAKIRFDYYPFQLAMFLRFRADSLEYQIRKES